MDKMEIMDSYIEGIDKGYTHLLIIKSMLDNRVFPVYVSVRDDINDTIKAYQNNNCYVLEVYNYSIGLIKQLHELRSYNIDNSDISKGNKRRQMEEGFVKGFLFLNKYWLYTTCKKSCVVVNFNV